MSNNLESSLPGMPPQTNQNSTPPEQADFGFMLNQQQPQAPSSPGARFAKFGKPAKLLIAALVVLIIVIVAALIFGGGANDSKQVLDLMAQNQEITRVSQLQDQKLSDENTKGLSATTQATMNSQKAELGSYLSKAKAKYSPQQLAAKQSSDTDTQLQAAAQNNNLDQAYASYLKTSLTNYLNSLSGAFKATKSQTLKSTLQSAYDSVQTLLKSPQFRS
ncbi:MAG: hypothetical protein WEC17_02085 [Candidatus Saccharimonadales bacterium]